MEPFPMSSHRRRERWRPGAEQEPVFEGEEQAVGGPDASTSLGELRHSIAKVVDHIEAMIAEAENGAGVIRREAEVEADRYLAEKRREADRLETDRMAEMNEVLNAVRSTVRTRLARIERESEEMLRAVEEAIFDSAGRSRGADERTTSSPTAYPGASPAAPTAYPGASPTAAPTAYPGARSSSPRSFAPAQDVAAEPPSRGSDAADAALLRARQMAVKGAGPEEVEAELREQIGPAEAREIIDYLFAP
jgi:hypothetical protein